MDWNCHYKLTSGTVWLPFLPLLEGVDFPLSEFSSNTLRSWGPSSLVVSGLWVAGRAGAGAASTVTSGWALTSGRAWAGGVRMLRARLWSSSVLSVVGFSSRRTVVSLGARSATAAAAASSAALGFRTSTCVGRLTLSLLADSVVSRSLLGDRTGLAALDGAICVPVLLLRWLVDGWWGSSGGVKSSLDDVAPRKSSGVW